MWLLKYEVFFSHLIDCDSFCSDPEHIIRTNMSLQWALHDAMLNAQEREQFVGGVHSAAEQLDQ